MAHKFLRHPLVIALLVPVGRLLLVAYWSVLRVSTTVGSEHLDKLAASGAPFIPCYWHQMHFGGGRLVRGWLRRGVKIAFLISPSKDGEIPARLVRAWGAEAIRGSSSQTGAQALRDLYQLVREQGVSPLMTSDGPRGPLHEFKPGAVLLAQMTGAPILPIAYAASRSWQLGSWDRFIVPKPFSRIAYAIGPPRSVSRDLTLGEIASIQRELEQTMKDLITAARAAL